MKKIGPFPGSRANFLAIVLLLATSVIIFRLFQIQIIDHSHYTELGEEQHIKQLAIHAKRGEIYTYDTGNPTILVMNERIYTLFIDPMIISEPDRVREVINSVAGGNLTVDLSGAITQTSTRYQIVAKGLTRKQAEMIKDADLSGVGFHETTRRIYPEGSLASQTLGFVNAEGVGQYGIEEALNQRLVGTDGRLQTVTDVNYVPLTIGDKNTLTPAKNGDNLVLTIDRNIQRHVEQTLQKKLKEIGADQGNVIILDPSNGHILAMANLPSFDVSNYTKAKDTALFNNPVLTDPYEPGSVIKPFTMAVGIDRGVVTPSSTYYNRDYIIVDDRTINNSIYGYTGNISMQTAMNYSLNTGMVTIVQRLGDGEKITRGARDTIYDYFHGKFHFGQKTSIELFESPGIVIPPTEVEGNAVRYSNMSFGQGMNLSMLQVAAAFGAIITDGTYHSPTVIAGVMQDGKFVAESHDASTQVVKSGTATTIRNMLIKARKSSLAYSDKAGYTVGGKTGTSQVVVDGVYSDKTTIASYLGFGGDSSPRYVIMVRVKSDGSVLGGSTAAGPIFTELSNWMIGYLNLKPRSN